MKIYGPYSTGQRDRLLMVKIDDEGNYSSQSYPRYLMEQHLGRVLRPDEEVHHIDEDKHNNAIENLQVLTKAEHNAIHDKRTFHECQNCGKMSRRTKYRKYCSPECSRIGSRHVERPSAEQLTEDLSGMSWSAVGRKYDVSDNAVRKWAKSYGLL
jgi:hypothetical protein